MTIGNVSKQTNELYNQYNSCINNVIGKGTLTKTERKALRGLDKLALKIETKLHEVDQARLSKREIAQIKKAEGLCERIHENIHLFLDKPEPKTSKEMEQKETKANLKKSINEAIALSRGELEKFQVSPSRLAYVDRGVRNFIINLLTKIKSFKDIRVETFRLYEGRLAAENAVRNISRLEKGRQKIMDQIEHLNRKKETLQSSILKPIEGDTKHQKAKKMNLLSQLEDTRSKLKQLQTHLEEIDQNLSKNNSRYEIWEKSVKLGEKTRENLEAVGGKRLTLEASDGVKIDATYLSVKSFKQKLVENGAKHIHLRKDSQELEGISFNRKDWLKNKDHILNQLDELNTLFKMSEKGPKGASGWVPVRFQDKVVLVPTTQLPNFNKETPEEQQWIAPVSKTGSSGLAFRIQSQSEIKAMEQNIDVKESNKTVILAGGNDQCYEMLKEEAMAFLMRGSNVMLFNYRGHGISEGTPSQNGWLRDINAAYKYVKQRTEGATDEEKDKNIMIKGTCLSGGPAAYIGAKHPSVNLFIDRSYSEMKQKVIDLLTVQFASAFHVQGKEDRLEEKEKSLFLYKIKRGIAKLLGGAFGNIGTFFVPNYDVMQNIVKNKGHKAILYTLDDEMYSMRSHVEKNLTALAKAGKLEETTVLPHPGGHGVYWVRAQAMPLDYFDGEIIDKLQLKQGIRTHSENDVRVFNKTRQIGVDKSKKANELREKEKKLSDEIEVLKSKIEKKKKIYRKLRQRAKDIKSGKIEQGKKTPKELRKRVSIIKEKCVALETKIGKKQKVLEKITKKREVTEKWFENTVHSLGRLYDPTMDESLGKETFIMRDQVDHFLKKCEFYNPVIAFNPHATAA